MLQQLIDIFSFLAIESANDLPGLPANDQQINEIRAEAARFNILLNCAAQVWVTA
jgi:hypothetical protein